MKAAGASQAGGAITRAVSPAMTSFFLQAYVYDGGCAGAAWVSPDWGTCTDVSVASEETTSTKVRRCRLTLSNPS
jgi:hypothetical protein